VNLLRSLPDASAAECVDPLMTRPGLRFERIVSFGQASPPGFWYDQSESEWVLLLAGAARLRFADENEARHLGPGDWLEIPSHRRHRVDWTDPATPTVWLAVFLPIKPRSRPSPGEGWSCVST
jgi:cupin 2 domain-containing protein